MGNIIALFVIVTLFGILAGILLAKRGQGGSTMTSLILIGLVVVGIGYIIAGNNRSGDGFGDLRELFVGSLAIWAALMVCVQPRRAGRKKEAQIR